jgi:hypothetical protein
MDGAALNGRVIDLQAVNRVRRGGRDQRQEQSARLDGERCLGRRRHLLPRRQRDPANAILPDFDVEPTDLTVKHPAAEIKRDGEQTVVDVHVPEADAAADLATARFCIVQRKAEGSGVGVDREAVLLELALVGKRRTYRFLRGGGVDRKRPGGSENKRCLKCGFHG